MVTIQFEWSRVKNLLKISGFHLISSISYIIVDSLGMAIFTYKSVDN